MGYRSDVAICIYGDTDDVTAFVATEKLKDRPKGTQYHPMEEDTQEGYHEREVYPIRNGKETVMEWTWWGVKWYDNYPEVKYWEELASVWHDSFKNTSLCMEIAKVGENADDIECDYYGENCEYYLSISRNIEKSMPYEGGDRTVLTSGSQARRDEVDRLISAHLGAKGQTSNFKSKMANGDQHEKSEWGQEADTTFPYGKRRTK